MESLSLRPETGRHGEQTGTDVKSKEEPPLSLTQTYRPRGMRIHASCCKPWSLERFVTQY